MNIFKRIRIPTNWRGFLSVLFLLLGVASVSIAYASAGISFSQPSPSPLPGLITVPHIQKDFLSRDPYRPLLTQSLAVTKTQPGMSPPKPDTVLSLCATLLGNIPFAVFKYSAGNQGSQGSQGSQYVSAKIGDTIDALHITSIQSHEVLFNDGTTLFFQPCGDISTIPSSTNQSGVAPIMTTPFGNQVPPPSSSFSSSSSSSSSSGATLPFPTATPYTPNMYGQPLPSSEPYPYPVPTRTP